MYRVSALHPEGVINAEADVATVVIVVAIGRFVVAILLHMMLVVLVMALVPAMLLFVPL